MRFNEIIGQREVKTKLINTVKSNRISHAQLFLGPEGSGSLALAIAYSQYICCENRTETDSCGICRSCVKFQKLIHPDLHFSFPFVSKDKNDHSNTYITNWRSEILADPYLTLERWLTNWEGENKQPNLNAKECSEIQAKLSLTSFESEFKILIMWLPEYLMEVGNSLLKLIEEPPEKTLLIFVASDHDKILKTILSRTQLVKIPKIADGDLSEYLHQNTDLDAEHLSSVLMLSNGNYNEAMNFANNKENKYQSEFINWMRLCFRQDIPAIVEWSEGMAKNTREVNKSFFRYSLKMIEEAVVYSFKPESNIISPITDFLKKFSPFIHLQNSGKLRKELDEAHYHIERNANPKILFLAVSLKLTYLLKADKNLEQNILLTE